jgi:hypothetical protein
VASGLLLNLPSMVVLLWVAYRVDQSSGKGYAQLIFGYLWLISPFYGIVQLDLVAAALLALAVWLTLRPKILRLSIALGAVLLVAASVSTKPQLALVLWVLCGLLLAVRLWRWRVWIRPIDFFLLVLLTGSLIGFASDYAIRTLAGRSDSMRTTSAVTLYSGLLVSGTERGCGYWSVQAGEAAKADMDRPLIDAVVSRITTQPASHWLQVIACKTPQIVLPPPYALYWLVESPNVMERLHTSTQREYWQHIYVLARAVERLAYAGLAFAILVAVLVTGVKGWRRYSPFAILAPAWVLAFWLVHAVFEIQGRYFLPMFTLAPILCAASVSLGETIVAELRLRELA